jgi:hypothetical protein
MFAPSTQLIISTVLLKNIQKGIIFKLFEELSLIINPKLIPLLTGSMLTGYGLSESQAHCSELLSHSINLKQL